MAKAVCNVPGCPTVIERGKGRCPNCARRADQARGSSTARGYARRPEHRHFREAVLARNPNCVADGCTAPATVADHFPLDRRELVRRGLDPDDPRYGRGLCASCHGKHTATAQPGGWNAS